jgi:hypothetical protein
MAGAKKNQASCEVTICPAPPTLKSLSFFSPPGGTATDNVFRSATSAMTLWRGVFTKVEYLILNHHTRADAASRNTRTVLTDQIAFAPASQGLSVSGYGEQ